MTGLRLLQPTMRNETGLRLRSSDSFPHASFTLRYNELETKADEDKVTESKAALSQGEGFSHSINSGCWYGGIWRGF